MLKSLFSVLLAVIVTATGYGDNPIMAERAAKAICYNSAAKILCKDAVRPIRIISKVTGESGSGVFCLIKMEVK